MSEEAPDLAPAGRLVTRRRVLLGSACAGGGLVAAKLGGLFGDGSSSSPMPIDSVVSAEPQPTGLAAASDQYACARVTAWSKAASGGADVFETGEFPFGPRTHDLGWKYMFDLAIVGTLLKCRPGDRVLDVGSGSGPSTEALVRFGYDAVALDPDHLALTQALKRLHMDSRLAPHHGSAVTAIAERLPFADATFDGIIGMNVLHHVDDLEAAAKEFARVLKPGRRAAFCEPGTRHLEAAVTRNIVRETHADEQAFDVRQFGVFALANGFTHVELEPYVYPTLSSVEVWDLDAFARGALQNPLTRPQGLARSMVEQYAVFSIVRSGDRALDSRFPGRLACDIEVDPLPGTVKAGALLEVRVRARNAGDTLWLAQPHEYGGYVTFGSKLVRPDGSLVSDTIGRTTLSRDVAAGESASGVMKIRIPPDTAPGPYALHFDMVDEWIGWFSRGSTSPLRDYPIRVEPA